MELFFSNCPCNILTFDVPAFFDHALLDVVECKQVLLVALLDTSVVHYKLLDVEAGIKAYLGDIFLDRFDMLDLIALVHI